MARIFTEMTTDKTRVCKVCGRELSIDAFETNPRFKGMKGCTCHECVTSAKSLAAQRNRERQEANRKAYAARMEAHAIRVKGFAKELAMKGENGCLRVFTTEELIVELRSRGFFNHESIDLYREVCSER